MNSQAGATSQRKPQLSTVREFGRRLTDQKRTFFLACSILILNTLVSIAIPRLLGWTVDSVLLQGKAALLTSAVIIFIALDLTRVFSARLLTISFAELGQIFMASLRSDLIRKVLSLPVLSIRAASTGALTARLTADVSALGSMFEATFLKVVERLFMVVGILISIFLLAPKLGASALVLLPLFVALGIWVTKRLFTSYHTMRRETEALQASLSETVRGIEVVRLYGLEHQRINQYTERSKSLKKAAAVDPRLFGILHPSMTLVIGLSIAVFLSWGGRLVQDGAITPGTLVTLVSYVILVFWPILVIINQWNVFLQGMAAAERLFEVLGWESEQDGGVNLSTTIMTNSIEFRQTTFTYPNSSSGVRNLSFTIKDGSHIGIVGASGAGKSTLVQLLLGFLRPQAGNISIAGQDITDLSLNQLRGCVGYASQNVFLFDGSVKENLLWAVDPQKLIAAAHDDSLPPSARRLLADGERHVSTLSHGERQLLSILRLVLRDPMIWMLDEPSASLDPATEQWLHRVLMNQRGKRTVLMISHRLKAVHDLDQLYVLHEGELIEQGKHDELIKANGLYANLYRLQQIENH